MTCMVHADSHEKKMRLFDIIFSLLVLLAMAPLFFVISILIKLESCGPVIFKQKRIGKKGVPFDIYKFRTMVNNAEARGPRLTVENDPRITRVGSFLRRFSLDEIPNFINVLKGEMSIVGPRPEIPAIVERYSPRQRKVLSVKPGITGFAQLNGRDDVPVSTKLELESWYVSNRTVWSDLIIVLLTPFIIFTGEGTKC